MANWTITWGTRTWTDDDLVAGDLVSIQILVGGGWENLNPFAGPLQLMATIAALECRSSGRDLEEIMTELRESPAVEVLGAIVERDPTLRAVG